MNPYCMPKEAITWAMRDLANHFKSQGYKGVWIPNAKSQSCQWTEPRRKNVHGKWVEWDVMLEVLEFALNNAFVRMPDGRILQQVKGIPMGDPLSPGMTIGTCAWMEREWIQGLHPNTHEYFRAARYMDDVLMITRGQSAWDEAAFLKDFTKSECYWAPLKLEEGARDTFLEGVTLPYHRWAPHIPT